MTPHEFADKHMHPYKDKGDELIATYCPFCNGGHHRDKNTFALNVVEQVYKCHRGRCGAQGHFVELCRHFGELAKTDTRPNAQPVKKYKPPAQKLKPISQIAMDYLKTRGISEATIKKFGVGVDEQGNLMFPYLDEKGEHVFTKFRPARKIDKSERKMWRETDTMPILFGMNLCDVSKLKLTITEGEIDAMTLHEAGIPNAVSVPSGTEDFTWIDTCWDFIAKFKTITLFGDNDEAGQKMIRKLLAKLGDHRLAIVEHECKDANELLYKHGKEAVSRAWSNAKEVPVNGLLNLAEVMPLDPRNLPKSTTSIKELDRIIGGFNNGDVTVWTGKRGSGKSTVLSQIMLDAIEQGLKVCAYSGELKSEQYQYWTDLQAAGSEYVTEYFNETEQRKVRYVEAETRSAIHAWYNQKYWLYDNRHTLEDEEAGIIAIFERAARRYDCSVFLIDNLMTAQISTIRERDYLLQQTKFVNTLAKFANVYSAHIHLVAHPRKTSDITDSDEVSGSANITNRAANVISVTRCGMDEGNDLILRVLKNRWEGKNGEVRLNYDEKSRRVFDSVESVGKKYGWIQWREISESERGNMPW